MPEIKDYAVLSASAYQAKRDPGNWIVSSNEWSQLSGEFGYTRDIPSGFEAKAFRSKNSVIIAFTGTDEIQDWLPANITLALGFFNPEQLKKAALFYTQIKQHFASQGETVQISFTGHSLGGGLAALMGVLFDKPAVTFDPAPFRQSANNDIRASLQGYLATVFGMGYAAPDLSSFHSDQEAADNGKSTEPGIRGEENVSRIVAVNEVLSAYGPDALFLGRTPTPISHGSPDADKFDLHSIVLPPASE